MNDACTFGFAVTPPVYVVVKCSLINGLICFQIAAIISREWVSYVRFCLFFFLSYFIFWFECEASMTAYNGERPEVTSDVMETGYGINSSVVEHRNAVAAVHGYEDYLCNILISQLYGC